MKKTTNKRLIDVLKERSDDNCSPVADADIKEKRKDSQSNKTHSKSKVLIVDDLPFNRIVTKQMLIDAFDCKEAENGEQAVHCFSEEQPDLILMDISMPVMDGIEALEKIRQLSSPQLNIPIIAVTTGGLTGNREELLDKGFSEFIKKPVVRSELYTKIGYFLPKSISKVKSGDI